MTDSDTLRSELTAALKALGDTPDAVADTLRALGITGVRRSHRTCPVARYLSEVFGPDVSVGRDMSHVRVNGVIAETTTPQPVTQFISLFDNGRYPDLEAS